MPKNFFGKIKRSLSIKKNKKTNKSLATLNPGSNHIVKGEDPKIQIADEVYSAIQLRDIYTKEELQKGFNLPEDCNDKAPEFLKSYYHQLCLIMTNTQQLLHRQSRDSYINYVLAIESANDLCSKYMEKLNNTKTKDDVKNVEWVKKDYEEFIKTLSHDERREHDNYYADIRNGTSRSSSLNPEQIAIKLFAISKKYPGEKKYLERYRIYERKLTPEQIDRVMMITNELYMKSPTVGELNGLYINDTESDCDAIVESVNEGKARRILYSDTQSISNWADRYKLHENYTSGCSNFDKSSDPRFFKDNRAPSEADSAISDPFSIESDETIIKDSIESYENGWQP